MKYRIYQPKEINFLVDDSKITYFKDEYVQTYEDELNEEIAKEDKDWILERLFEIFNIRRPEDFKGHSLSCNDIVELDNKAYLCDVIGWKEINFA